MSVFTSLSDDVRQLLSRLDIVVPTYNRPEYALRLMRFWSGTGARVFVLDGSDQAIDSHLIAELGKNIEYLHLPMSYQERFRYATGVVSREFQMMMSDDELYVPSAVASAIEHLDENPAHWAVTGRVIRFYCKQGNVLGEEWYTGYNNYVQSALSADQVQRAYQFEVPHYAMLGVIRGDHWRDLWSMIFRHDYTCPYAYEAMFHMTAPYIGITWVIDELLWLRSSETDENVSSTWDRRISLHEWFDHDAFRNERTLWEQSVAAIIARFAETPMSETQASEIASFIINRQVAGSRPKTYTWTPGQRLHRFARRLTPQTLRTLMKLLLPSSVLGRLGYVAHPLPDVADDMKMRGVRVDSAQLARIVDYIRDFHAAR
jgi:glycosyltransferase domain-containing protein